MEKRMGNQMWRMQEPSKGDARAATPRSGLKDLHAEHINALLNPCIPEICKSRSVDDRT